MKLAIPELALVVLIGPTGSGKSTFAHKHFQPSKIIAPDSGLPGSGEQDVYRLAAERLVAGHLTVIDAPNLDPEARQAWLKLAHRYYCAAVAIVFNLPEAVCLERQPPESQADPEVIRQQCHTLQLMLPTLEREGFDALYVLSSPEEVEAAWVERRRLPVNWKHEHGPFDIIGDVHGCFDELVALLKHLGYTIRLRPGAPDDQRFQVRPPAGRKAIFLGDLVDRGPYIPATLRLVMSMVRSGAALCVIGNHDDKLLRKLKGRNVQIKHGLEQSLAQLEQEPAAFKSLVIRFLESLPSHYMLDGGRLVVAHAGMKAEMQGRDTKRVRDFALYGETTGELDEFGLPIRYNWAAEYRGQARVVYGHTPVFEPEWLNGTINIDTGCVFGGRLTALRYPELELVSIPAARAYAQSLRFALPQDNAGTPGAA